MGTNWIATKYTGVRYREHPSRVTRNGQPDKYFTIRYRARGERTEERLGWASEGWTAEKAHGVLANLKKGILTGKGPQSLADMRERAEAEREAERAEREAEKLGLMLLKDYLIDYYIPHVKKHKRSWKLDEQRIHKAVIPAIGSIPLRCVTKEDVQGFLDGLTASGAAPETVKQYMALVRRAYNVGAKTLIDGKPLYMGINPANASELTLPCIFGDRERYLLADEVDKLIAAAAKLRCPDLHDAIVISLNTGLRMGEILRLDWLDMNMAHQIVTVRGEDKRKPGGKVPLNRDAMAVFQRRKDERAVGGHAGLVFPSLMGADFRSSLSHSFRDIVEEVGLNKGIAKDDRQRRVVFHTLRHTFASWLALAGTDLYRIKTLMRHKTIAMTMRYAHLVPDATRDAVHNLRPPKGS